MKNTLPLSIVHEYHGHKQLDPCNIRNYFLSPVSFPHKIIICVTWLYCQLLRFDLTMRGNKKLAIFSEPAIFFGMN